MLVECCTGTLILVAHGGSYSAETEPHGTLPRSQTRCNSRPLWGQTQCATPGPFNVQRSMSNARRSTLTRTRIHPHSHTPRETCRPGRPARIIPGLWSPSRSAEVGVRLQVPTTYLACPGAACALSLPYPCLHRYPQIACAQARGRRTLHVWSTKAAPNRMPCLQGCAPRAL